jgi:hypothetical protein
MPALINTRLAAAFEAIPVAERSAEKLALAAYRVMEGAALALGLPSTGVAFFKPGAHPVAVDAFVVEWLDGPTEWAFPAAIQNEPRAVMIAALPDNLALEFFAVRS